MKFTYHIQGYGYSILPHEDVEPGYGSDKGTTSEKPTKVTPDTVFNAGDTVKSFTAAAVATLIHPAACTERVPQGLQWATPVSQQIPQHFKLQPYQLPKEDGEDVKEFDFTEWVTVSDILTHQSGMPGYMLLALILGV